MADRDVVRPPIGAAEACRLLALFGEPVQLPDFAQVAWTAHFWLCRRPRDVYGPVSLSRRLW